MAATLQVQNNKIYLHENEIILLFCTCNMKGKKSYLIHLKL